MPDVLISEYETIYVGAVVLLICAGLLIADRLRK